jgi:signal transduction histidine kinase
MSIRTRLFLCFAALSVLGMLLLTGFAIGSARETLISAARTELDGRAEAAAENVADALEAGDLVRLRLLVDRYGHQQHVNARAFAPDGTLLASSIPISSQSPLQQTPGAQEALTNLTGYARDVVTSQGKPELYEARALRRGGRLLGLFWMSLRLQTLEEHLQHLTRDFILALTVIGALSLLVSVLLARMLAEPIQQIRTFAVRLGGGVFGDRLDFNRKDELGQLATELNRMSERLASDERRRRTFVANVSHELRTPVTNVRVALEALENGAYDEPELRDRFIGTCLDETTRLARLIELLLDLGRYEADAAPLDISRVELSELIRQCQRVVEGRLLQHDLQIEVKVPHVWLRADKDRLLRVFVNLVDNAINYAAPHSVITMYGHLDGQSVFVEVCDQGPGISELDLPHIFEEFYTADRSRMRRGSGLGLPIARRIVEAHGGTISAVSTTGKGSTFTVCLPLPHAEVRTRAGSGHTKA